MLCHLTQHQPKNFVEAWAAAKKIKGWLTKPEACHLFRAALEIKNGFCITEVGTYRGKSSVLMAHTQKDILSVDPMESVSDPLNRINITPDDIEALQEAIEAYPNLKWVPTKAETCPLPEVPVGLLFIDGNHQYPQPLQDFEHFLPALRPGSYVAFHDYKRFEGVTRSVQLLEQSGLLINGRRVGTLYIGTYPGSDPRHRKTNRYGLNEMRVTGFHLVVLCHRFRRRGRAFAYSLANQRNNPYPLHLTVFYSEASDADYILEGARAGTSSLEVDLVHVSEKEIMRRALHFSSVQPEPFCSHLIFTDADLWFPPEFWKDYGNCLHYEQPGYWSCHVCDLDLRKAEKLLSNWPGISVEQLKEEGSRFRYNRFRGKVGHFQCVPRDFIKYTKDSRKSVKRTDEKFAASAIAVSADKRTERRIGRFCAYHLGHQRCWKGTKNEL